MGIIKTKNIEKKGEQTKNIEKKGELRVGSAESNALRRDVLIPWD